MKKKKEINFRDLNKILKKHWKLICVLLNLVD